MGNDSALDPEAMARARALLAARARHERMWPALAAAALLATSALAFATAMVLAPPVITRPAAPNAPG
ncbi:hypothetical protein [Phenylobacterium sp.]|uniref:hypothetical protein n=1 Tax=Phenylobacterium sp. TaxID=1871053 RepID=UPI00281140B6|nr:hypothetical protein [Phenylobacterium sp.]